MNNNNQYKFSNYSLRKNTVMSVIPKVIYCFWDNVTIPKLIRVCINSWKIHNPMHKIVVMNEKNFLNYTSRQLPAKFSELKIQKKANWIRTAVLSENGGIWIDASMLMTKPLDFWLYTDNADFIGVKNGIRIENWFFAAPKDTRILNDWIVEYEKAIDEGAENYVKRVGPNNKWTEDAYLYHQLCLLNVIKNSNSEFTIRLYDTEVAFSKLLTDKWYDDFKASALDLGKNDSNYWKYGIPPMYKIVGLNRKQAVQAVNGTIEYNSPLNMAGMITTREIRFKTFIIMIIGFVILYTIKCKFQLKRKLK
jgi:hypothetical protein